ncbi:MAG: acetate--CoA ligase family protein [Methanocellales archaeon]
MNEIIERVKKEGRRALIEPEARELLKKYGIPVLPYKIAKKSDEAINAAQELGYPAVMKIISAETLHKSDVGGVKLNLKNSEDIIKAFNEIPRTGEGVLISPMVSGVELFLGVIQDAQFGPVLAFGFGGKYVEVFKDISFRLAPVSREDAVKMIEEIKSSVILKGIRGEKPRDIEAIVDAILKLSKLAIENPDIKEIDLNPVFAFEKGKGIAVGDVRMML